MKTKNIIKVSLIFVAILAFTGGVSAQVSTVISLKQFYGFSQNNAAIQKTIGLYPDMALSYYEYYGVDNNNNTITKGRFVLNINGASVYKFDMDPDIHILDFKQSDDPSIIVFCGYKGLNPSAGTTIGIVGWFHLSLNTINLEIMEENECFRFWKVEGFYNDAQSISIVAIGQRNVQPYTYSIFCWYDINTLNVDNYFVRQSETLWDIVKTEKYVVFVGVENAFPGLCLRKEFYNGFAAHQTLDTVFGYILPNDEPSSYPVAAFMGNDMSRSGNMIAVSTPVYNDILKESRYRFIDVASMNMTGAQSFKMYEKIATLGMTYINDNKTLIPLLALNPADGSNIHPAILLEPYNTSAYTAPMVYDAGTSYNSIDNLNQSLSSTEHFILGGFNQVGLGWFLKKASNLTTPNNCHSVSSISVNDIKPINSVFDLDPLSSSSLHNKFPLQSDVVLDILIHDCPDIEIP